MALTWTSHYSATETQGDFQLKTQILIAPAGSGYLLRVERELLYKGYLPVMPKTALAYVAAGVPTTLTVSEESSTTATTTDPENDDVSFIMTDKTYLITPRDGSNNPIGTARGYLSTKFVRLPAEGLTGSHDLALAVVP